MEYEGDPLLTVGELAALLGVEPRTVYGWRQGRGPGAPRAVKVGGVLRFRRSDVEAWLEAHTENPGSEDA